MCPSVASCRPPTPSAATIAGPDADDALPVPVHLGADGLNHASGRAASQICDSARPDHPMEGVGLNPVPDVGVDDRDRNGRDGRFSSARALRRAG
jgi:hypothetical protein